MNIRPLNAEDVTVVAAWVVTIPLWQRYGASADVLAQRLLMALDTDLILTADTDDQAVGLAWCVPTGGFGRSAYLRMLGVRPDQAGGGVGAALLSALEATLASHDLFLLTSDFNVDAQRFYQRQGYEQIGAIPGYVLPDVTELIYRKRLR
ncbi:MAG: GNAT family N-acetyltransferase [Chloroflexi bacterium]|nr:GNAT family N-acetyltransferase [Chloroflexota bacterium]